MDPVASVAVGAGSQNFIVIATLVAVIIASVFIVYSNYNKTQLSDSKKPKQLNVVADASTPAVTKEVVRLIYGTQTGNAERFSKLLGNELKHRYGDETDIQVLDIERYDHETELSKEKMVVICLSTYGDGDPTDSAGKFVSWLEDEVEAVENGDKQPPLEVRGRNSGVYEKLSIK